MPMYFGSNKAGSIYLGSTKIGTAYMGSVKVYEVSIPLPANTIRVKFTDGFTPTMGTSQSQVSVSPNVWDITNSSTDWQSLFAYNFDLLEVLGANTSSVTNMPEMFKFCNLTTVHLFDTSSVTNMSGMFGGCRNLVSVPLFDTSSVTDMNNMLSNCGRLTSVPLFDTSSVTDMTQMFNMCSSLTTVPTFDTSSVTKMDSMFNWCESLTTVPLFDTSSATNLDYMFSNCTAVQSGALALYQQASTQTVPPSSHINTFTNCGSNTTTGAAELAQIPSDWK